MRIMKILAMGTVLAFAATSVSAQTVGIGTTKGGATAQVTAGISKIVSSHAGGMQMRTQVMGGATASEIKLSAAQRGMISLRADGRDKICAGVTTPDEVLRVTQLDVE